ncbi:nuclear transport factor 2 family protein [Acidobacteria bacterium AB60]|nr:nuclear transport factor 2 family protein [Acidobacteria bacterium AB60]
MQRLRMRTGSPTTLRSMRWGACTRRCGSGRGKTWWRWFNRHFAGAEFAAVIDSIEGDKRRAVTNCVNRSSFSTRMVDRRVSAGLPSLRDMPFSLELHSVRRSCQATLLIALTLTVGFAQAAKPGMPRAERHESKHEIDQLEQNWRDAMVHRNVQAMDALLADDYIAITANGMLQSKEQALANLKNGSLRIDGLEFSDRKVRFYGQTALVTSKAEVRGNRGDGEISGSYRYTRVYAKDAKGAWKIVSFEASRIREPGERKVGAEK